MRQNTIHPNHRFLCGDTLRYVVALFVMWLAGSTVWGQTYNMVNETTITIHGCGGESAVLYDDGGVENNYSNYFEGYALIIAPTGGTVHLSGSYNTESNYDKITIYNGSTNSASKLVDAVSGISSINCTSSGQYMLVYFKTDGSVSRTGFAFTVTFTGTTTCSNPVTNLHVTSTNDQSATLQWSATNPNATFRVTYGNNTQYVSGTSVTLADLSYRSTVDVEVMDNSTTSYCCGDRLSLYIPCPASASSILDFTDLHSCSATCRYGTYSNPDANIGVIDNGYNSESSRHTVVTNANACDPRTGYYSYNQLHMVPPGASASVRLGNWDTGNEAESITYEYLVDTVVHNLLVLKYAVVLENPNHTADEQPKFTLRITDANGTDINTDCYCANFVANSSLGWNNYNGIIWKDWTTVGIDLSPLHGQVIFIKLTTYDCDQGGHYGYAYYTLNATTKQMASSSCGADIENTFTAPSGFSYKWYRPDNPNATLSTSQSFHVTQAGEYCCQMSFVGSTSSSCSFVMKAIAGERYPYAQCSYEMTPSGCDQSVHFTNASIITTDTGHLQLTDIPCESYYWHFGDGATSTENNPTHIYQPGTYDGYLVAMLSGGSCSDTLPFHLNIPTLCYIYDTINVAICHNHSYQLYDTVFATSGIHHRDSANHHTTLYLTINPPIETVVFDTVVENQLPWHFHSLTVYGDTTDADVTITSHAGCDSLIRYTLHVIRNFNVTVDSTICGFSLPFTWDGYTWDAAGTRRDTIPSSIFGVDSAILYNLTVLPWNPAVVNGLRVMLGNKDTITLTADSANSYLWSTGSTAQSIQVTHGGNYRLTVDVNEYCANSVDVTVTQLFPPLIENVPESICAGDTTTIVVGSGAAANIRVGKSASTLSDGNRIFLPDGVDCDPSSGHGCSYLSELVFDGFGNDRTISSVNDIEYVMLNIEHSYIGDLYINITCPNGQNADIMRFFGSGTSSCTGSIDMSHRGWHTGSNHSSGFLGNAYDNENSSYPCDSTLAENRAGLGYRYCWTDNASGNYSYGPDGGYVYRTANKNGNILDSSNVAAGTNFFHPDESFDSLIGCPMNGTWYIEVIDGWDSDNGYIFSWSLALNPDLLSLGQYNPRIVHGDLSGTYFNRQNDTTFIITPPQSLPHDTTVTYTVFLTDSIGARIDTTFTITFHSVDSVSIFDTCVENSLPRHFHSLTLYGDTTGANVTLTNQAGCDSIINYNLHVFRNQHVTFYDTLCADALPHTWIHRTFDVQYPLDHQPYTLTQLDTLPCHNGADSLITLQLTVLPVYHDTILDTICDNLSYTFEGAVYTDSGTYTHHLLTSSSPACDSIRTLQLMVHATTIGDTMADECDSFSWYGRAYTNDTTDTLRGVYANVFGCDSTAVLHLAVRYTTSSIVYDTCVENLLPRHFHSLTLYGDTTGANVTLTNQAGCDSIINYNLHVFRNQHVTFYDTLCADALPHTWIHRTFDVQYPLDHQPYTLTQLDTLPCLNGADSLITLRIMVLPVYHDTILDTICDNQSYTFEGAAYTDSGTYTHHLLTSSSPACDSIRTLHLTVNRTTSETVYDTCVEKQLPWHYYSLTIYGDTTDAEVTIVNQNGCDSIINYNLHVNYNKHLTLFDTICARSLPYIWNNKTFTSQHPLDHEPYTIAQSDTLLCQNGADSVLTMQLTVWTSFQIQIMTDPKFLDFDHRQLKVTSSIMGNNDWYSWAVWYDDIDVTPIQSEKLYLEVPPEVDSVTLLLAVGDSVCSDTASTSVLSYQSEMFIPNVFTPSLPTNNIFYCMPRNVVDFEIWIYDREGRLVYHSIDYNEGWDGTHNGTVCPQANYVYTCKYTTTEIPGARTIRTGSVLLLR